MTRDPAGVEEVGQSVAATRTTSIRTEEVIPAAARTISSLRDIGYELPQAVADIVDNSIEAEATDIRVDLAFDGVASWIRIADNGTGMDSGLITESLRYGSMRPYGDDDLGKFGFGLKTASTSQCRRVVVASRRAKKRARIEVRALDLKHIEKTNKWEILVIAPTDRPEHLVEPLLTNTGTVVLWEDLDRVLDYKDPYGGWARRKLLEQAEAIAEHLGMVFHRYISGQVRGRRRVRIFVNGSRVDSWDPFCADEPATTALPVENFPVASESGTGIVQVRPYVLPDKNDFSDAAAWARASGPLKWNRQQGLYIYRSNRLIQWGGWSRIRTIDEHTKLARVVVDFAPTLDPAFGVNISKAMVKLPPSLRDQIEPTIATVARIAQQRYRRTSSNTGTDGWRRGRGSTGTHTGGNSAGGASGARSEARGGTDDGNGSGPTGNAAGATAASGAGGSFGGPTFTYGSTGPGPDTDVKDDGTRGGDVTKTVGQAIEAAARAAGEYEAFERIAANLRRSAPEVAHGLGW